MLSIPKEAIEVRNYNPESDKAFVYSTWLKNYKHCSYFAKRIKSDIFFIGHHKILDHLISKPSVVISVASPKGEPDTILGYIAYEFRDSNPIIHFILVKEAYQKMGIARTMIEAALINVSVSRFSHWTFPVDELIRKWPGMIYDPYCL